jgi:site-specific DNA recombinase
MRAVLYVRVSSKEQTKNLSLPVQEAACRDFCERLNWEVAEFFVEEGESAKSADRTALKELLTYCRRNRGRVHAMVVYSVDRFARDLHDHAVIRHLLATLGISLRSVTQPIDDTPSGKLMEGVLASFAEYDNLQKREKVIAGMKAAAERGQWAWQAPIGYLQVSAGRGKTLLPDPQRAELVGKAFALYASGLHHRNDVLKMITELGLRTRRGRPLSPQTFAMTLRNQVYIGRVRVPKWQIDAQGNFPPLIDEATFWRVQALLGKMSPTVTDRQRNHPDFPLRGFVRCGGCNCPLTASWSKGRSARYAYYRCPAAGCNAVNVAKTALEGEFLALLDDLKPAPEYLDLFTSIVLDVWKSRRAEVTERRAALERRQRELKTRKDRLNEVFIYQQAIERETYEEHVARLNEEVAVTQLELHDARLEELDVEAVLEFARHLVLNAGRMWGEASLDQRQRLQAVLFPEGLRYADGGFGTAVTCPIFNGLGPVSEVLNGLVSPTGFEPVLPP